MSAAEKWVRCWKLTDQNGQTMGGTQWGEGVTNPCGVLDGKHGLCSSSFYHGYASPWLAVVMNPDHANITDPVLWQAEYRGTFADDNGLKLGATEFRTVRRVEIPVLTDTQSMAFAIYLAALVSDESDDTVWHEWAARWLSGDDRTWQSADRAWARASASASASARASTGAWAGAWARASASARARARASASARASGDDFATLFETAIAWCLVVEETP